MKIDRQREEFISLLGGDEDELRDVLALLRADEGSGREIPDLRDSSVPECHLDWQALAKVAAKVALTSLKKMVGPSSGMISSPMNRVSASEAIET